MRILSNAWMDAWDVTWPVDSPTPMHRHRFDYLGVELVASQNRLTAPDGQQREIALEEGRLWFLERGTTHAETGLSRDPERHAIIVDLKGPVPADTAFHPPRLKRYHAVIAMYHDQGLPVLKYMGFGRSVNITLGLPFIRTSVDHGTALDLAGRRMADAGSLLHAARMAEEMAAARGAGDATPGT